MKKSKFILIPVTVSVILVLAVFLAWPRFKQEDSQNETKIPVSLSGKFASYGKPLGLGGFDMPEYKNVAWNIHEFALVKNTDPSSAESKVVITAVFENLNTNTDVGIRLNTMIPIRLITERGDYFYAAVDDPAHVDRLAPLAQKQYKFQFFVHGSPTEIRVMVGLPFSPDKVVRVDFQNKTVVDFEYVAEDAFPLRIVYPNTNGAFCLGKSMFIQWSAPLGMRTVDLLVREASVAAGTEYAIGTFPAQYSETGLYTQGGEITWMVGQTKEKGALSEGAAYELIIQGTIDGRVVKKTSDAVFSIIRCEG